MYAIGVITWASEESELRRRLNDDQLCRPGEACDLTVSNFAKEIAGQTTLVKVWAPWCGHCQELAPHYKKATEELGKDGIKMMSLNYDDPKNPLNKKIVEKFGVEGFPTMLVFKNGKLAGKYKGKREAAISQSSSGKSTRQPYWRPSSPGFHWLVPSS